MKEVPPAPSAAGFQKIGDRQPLHSFTMMRAKAALAPPPAARGRCDAARAWRVAALASSREVAVPAWFRSPRPGVCSSLPSALSCSYPLPFAAHHGAAALQPRPLRGRRRLPPRPCRCGLCQSQVSQGILGWSLHVGLPSCRRPRHLPPCSGRGVAKYTHPAFLCLRLEFPILEDKD